MVNQFNLSLEVLSVLGPRACMHDTEAYEGPCKFRPEHFICDRKLNPTVCNPLAFAFSRGGRRLYACEVAYLTTCRHSIFRKGSPRALLRKVYGASPGRTGRNDYTLLVEHRHAANHPNGTSSPSNPLLYPHALSAPHRDRAPSCAES